MIIGLTGPNAAGKGEVAKYLQEKGFSYFSLSDILREEATKRGIRHSRENLISLGNELRAKEGFGVLAKRTNEKIRETKGPVVIDSIRSPFEVDELRKNKGFLLLGISADIETRFKRAVKRGRVENALTLEEFKEMEDKENTEKKGMQQLNKTFEMADVILGNDGMLDDLHADIDILLNRNIIWQEKEQILKKGNKQVK